MATRFAQYKELWGRLNFGQRTAVVGGALGTLAFIAVLVFFGSAPEYGVLFSDLKPADAQMIVDELKGSNVPYELTSGGTTVKVPVDRISEMRLKIAGSGRLSAGHVGFDLFDQARFGATDFEQQVNYQRAIEGELSRTLEEMDELEAARVHVVKPQESLYTERERPAKASVMLRVRQGRQLSPERVAAIVNLVSSAVEGLEPSDIAVTDTQGRLLSSSTEGAGGLLGDSGRFNSHLEARRKLEAETAARIVSLLEPVVGMGRVRADVAADLDFNQVEQTEEKYDPQSAVVRSQQSSQEVRATGGAAGAIDPSAIGGVAGSRANDPSVPPATVRSQTLPAGSDQRLATTTNYEIDRIFKKTIGSPGRVERLSVSVVVDFKSIKGVRTERTPEELQRLQELVSAAVGVNATRGDQVVVQSIPFDVVESEPVPATWLEANRDLVAVAIKYGLLVLAALLLIFFVFRPAKRALRAAVVTPELAAAEAPLMLQSAPPEPLVIPAPQTIIQQVPVIQQVAVPVEIQTEQLVSPDAPRTVAEIEAAMDHPPSKLENLATSADMARATALRNELIKLINEDPEMIAMTIRGWIREG